MRGESGPGYPQPCILLLLASSHLCPWHMRRPRVTSCTCVRGTPGGTGWSTNPWLLIPISRLVSPVAQDWHPQALPTCCGLPGRGSGARLLYVPIYSRWPFWSQCIMLTLLSQGQCLVFGGSLCFSVRVSCESHVPALCMCLVFVSVSISVPTLLCLAFSRCHSVVCRLC